MYEFTVATHLGYRISIWNDLKLNFDLFSVIILLKKFSSYLIEQNLVKQSELKEIEKRVQALVEEAVKFGLESPEPDPSELYKYIFAED